MRKYLPGLVLILFLFTFGSIPGQSQTIKTYEKEWKKVDDLVKKNLPKSALTEAKKVYDLSKKDGQDAQVIKSLVYLSGLQQQTREENEILSVAEFEKEIAASKEPVASILKSLLARQYWTYFQQHRWQLYQRTETRDFVKDNVATWSLADFHKKISELFRQSLKEEKLLQQTKLEPFDAIILKGNMRALRPTLYDLLAHQTLDYLKNNEKDLSKPAYTFEIDQPQAFAVASEFVTHKFITRDSASLIHKALLIYQQLISFHLGDAKPEALIDVDIERIEFVKNNNVLDNKDELYKKSLERITSRYPDNSAAMQAWYLIALQYQQTGVLYQPNGDTTHRYDKIKAKEICEKITRQPAGGVGQEPEGWVNCFNLLISLNQKELGFQLEKVNIPLQPFRVLVNYKNFNQLYLRLVKADDKIKSELQNPYDEKYWTTLIALSPIRSWQQSLPVTNDLQQHSTEIKTDALQAGEYILLASTENDFSRSKSVMGARIFYVSTISYVNNNDAYFVLNRENGQPLVNASVQFWQQRYDYKTSKTVKEKTEAYKTDGNGFFRLTRKANPESNSYSLDITFNNERFFPDEFIYNYYYSYNEGQPDDKNYEENGTRAFLFMDRSIYRPAQTIYFKGIVIAPERSARRNKIRSDYQTTVYLRDANYKDLDSIKVKTNEYGSFSGKFQLPQGGLNGQFAIHTTNNKGVMEFRVEDYKRPKFYVEYEKIKGTFKVNDKIRVTGNAKAYAGNNIDGALVKYRVVREPRFIYPSLFKRWWQPVAAPMEIAHGEIKIGTDGKFEIEFTAIPDLKIDRKFEPVFDYKLYADVTDINGETRSGQTVVSVSYKSLILLVNMPVLLPTDSLKSILIRTQNMNAQFEPSKVNVAIYKLKAGNRLIRKRYWQQPDQFVMPMEEYLKYFPYDEYKNETDYTVWEKGPAVFTATDSIIENAGFKISGATFPRGWYVVEIDTKDKNGETVKDVKYIELYDEKATRLDIPQYLWAKGPARPIEPGEKTTISIGSSAENLFVIQETGKPTENQKAIVGPNGQPVAYNYIKFNNEKRSYAYSAAEADRGGYGVRFFFVKHNRFYLYSDLIQVPWTNKDLSIEYATFRDKTLPGSEEKWKIKISGYKNEKVAAEMLAGMYDASLDQFAPHAWYEPAIWRSNYPFTTWTSDQNFSAVQSNQKSWGNEGRKLYGKRYDLLMPDYPMTPFPGGDMMIRGRNLDDVVVVGYGVQKKSSITGAVSNQMASVPLAYKEGALDSVKQPGDVEQPLPANDPSIQVRKNFNETAFFFPDLRTNSEGDIEFSFTIPEALTRWKFQALSHTKELAFGFSTRDVITQKQLMVQPNAPRFVREGDHMEFSAKIVNLTEKELTGQASLQLFDATTNEPVDGQFQNMYANQYFTVAAGQSEAIQFAVQVPYQFNKALTWRITAKTQDGAFSDGEESAIPVLTNRMLVTETMPMPMRGSGAKNFMFEKLLKSGASETLQNYSLTVEYTSNPAWYAVQALPYLMEYPYECAEQTWNRYYANSLASKIANSSPRIRQIFEQWKTTDTSALLSNLQKNEDLKSVLLEETPWVLQAKNEEQQKKNIALLFDLVRMGNELNTSFEKLKQMQSSNGGFVWFKGAPDDRYMTQYIITGIGHLKKLNGFQEGQDQKLLTILNTAIPYLDRKIKEDYDYLVRSKVNLKNQTIGYVQIQYLYMRSFFPEYEIAKASQTAYNYYRKQAQQFWTSQSKYMQGMIALALYRTNEQKVPAAILKSLKETSISNEEMGMYWKDLNSGWFWYQAPVETQALLIETFSEVGKDTKTVDDLRTWLLKNKQTNNWKTTKATAEACYALLLQGSEWLTNEPVVEIRLGNTSISNTTANSEAGTGYFKKAIEPQFIQPGMGNINVTISQPVKSADQSANSVSWGAVYWQYFEDLDKITTASTPLKLVKKLFIERNTDRGPVLSPVKENDVLKIGDKIKVRIELQVDRDMEYVHMKDMRAASLEPVNVSSGYKWQGGLGYYETTRDAGTNFFFNYLRKGNYVFEYPLFVTHTGNFSNGITTIQSMYAPEYTSHSEGIRITVE